MPYEVQPHKSKSYKFKQSKYDDVPTCPFRALCLGGSGAGKSLLIQNMICDVYDGVFDAGVHIFSASINVDDSWKKTKQWMESNDMPVEKHCHESFSEEKLAEIIQEQKEVITYMKNKGKKSTLPQMLIVMDDLLDNKEAMKGSRSLEILFSRGRHICCSTLVSVQKYRAVLNTARINSTDDIVFTSLRNAADYKAWAEETSQLVPEKKLMELYQQAKRTSPYAFLWLKKTGSEDDLVHIGFNPAEQLS